jgi:hypothetical protein
MIEWRWSRADGCGVNGLALHHIGIDPEIEHTPPKWLTNQMYEATSLIHWNLLV